MTGTVDGSVCVGGEDRTVRPHLEFAVRLVAGGVLNSISRIVAATRRVRHVIRPASFKQKRGFKEVLQLCVWDHAKVTDRLHIRAELAESATVPRINAPRSPIDERVALLILKRLCVERNDFINQQVRDDLAAFVVERLPRSNRRIGNRSVDDTRLAEVQVVLLTAFDDFRSPIRFASQRPVHRHQRPVMKILGHPYLRRRAASTISVGRGVKTVGVSKLLDRRIGEVTRHNGIARPGSVEIVSDQLRRDTYR